MFSKEKRCIYQNNNLGEVICQLRFPEILTIETTLPAQFQEAIRAVFPRYSVRTELSAPQHYRCSPKPKPITTNLPPTTAFGV